MQYDPLILAYLAGVIDSDGYITVQRSTHKGRLYFGAKIGISGTRREPHDLAASIWSGKVGCYAPANPLHKAQFQWTRSGVVAAEAIEALLPYLRIKSDQALVALELHEHVEFGRSDDPFPWFGPRYDPTPDRNELFLDAKALNGRKARAGRTLDGREWNEMPKGDRP
jgi:hypothetical protein